MKPYPTREGIAVPVWGLSFPESRFAGSKRHKNNHHAHFSSKTFGKLAVTQCLRDLERHQYVMPVDTHNLLHDIYSPPEFPTEDQAAKEIIDAYEHGEMFKRYDTYKKAYRYDEIPASLVDSLVAKYSLVRVFDMGMAAD